MRALPVVLIVCPMSPAAQQGDMHLHPVDDSDSWRLGALALYPGVAGTAANVHMGH